ncbi:MAG: YbhB/YbcL family Raf kinase inhibitor-like protein [Actinomycetota bacterium]|nr:YbhB/YbcL family Raf kinase inhibitor-like protein [Actinomycetota bacterium]
MADIELRSPAFADHDRIPARHAKEEDNLSPALEWGDVPAGTVELAVTCEDPDAPGGTFVHWVMAGIDPARRGLAEGETPAEAAVGVNDYGEQGYGGPRPPAGDDQHRYFFRLHAASEPLGFGSGGSLEELREALSDKELASGTLVGTYQR